MNLSCAILFSAMLLVAGTAARADPTSPYYARVWQAEDGLPENRVVGVVQGPDGYLWVSTQNGLVRFDGVRFQRVDLAGSPGKIAGTMRILMLDRSGRIWLAKEEGDTLFCFDGLRVRIVTAEQGLPDKETQSSMAVDSEGNLWVAYNTGNVIRCRPDGKIERFTTRDGLPDGGVCWLTTDRDGRLWFARGNHVGLFRNGRFDVLQNLASTEVRIAPARSGGIWIWAGQQVLKFDLGAELFEWGKIIPDKNTIRPSYEPSVLLEDREGAVWLGAAVAGLFRCESNSIVRVDVSNPAVLSLAEDREGNLWVGTRGGGLNQVHRRMVSMLQSSSGLPFEGVQSVCQDTVGELWMVGDNGILARGRGANWTVQLLTETAPQPYVTCAAAGTNGSVWIGTRAGGLYHWSAGKFKDLGLRAELHEKSLRSLLVMRNGDLWLAANSPDVLYRLRGDTLKSFDLPPGYRFIRAMAEDAAGNFWAGASDGLLVRISDDRLVDETSKSASLSIRCLHGAANGDLWLGFAGGGAGRLRNGELIRFTTEQGLPNDYVAQILTDNHDSIWFAGNQGIFQVREREFDDVAQGIAARVWPTVFGRSLGFSGLQASFDYCPASASGSNCLYFSMLSGLVEVRFEDARLNYRPPSVYIERISDGKRTFAVYNSLITPSPTNAAAPMELNGRSREIELRLPPAIQQVRFEFTALSFIAPDTVQFRYRLEGLDQDWVEAGDRRVAMYNRPPPGRYRFKVSACNNDGIWNQTGDTLAVVFAPYYWETLSFKLSMAALFLAALCGAMVLVLRRRHRLEVERLEHQRALEAERTRIARDLHDDLGVGLTEIGLLGDLAGTNGSLPQASREKLSQITSRARTLAASLDEIVWALNPANDTSRSLMEYFFEYAQKLLGEARIRCRFESVEPMPAGDLSAEDRHEVFHAFKEALNNIIRHSHATEVHVRLSAAEGGLLIRVADNGRGFVAPAGAGARNGLVGMRERLQRLGGRCEINGEPGCGTVVTFIVPMQPLERV